MIVHKDLVKNLVTLNQIVETLNQTVNVREALDFALTRLIELMGLETGWIFLKDNNSQSRWAGKGYVLAAHHNLPPAMSLSRARAWKGGCDCQSLCNRGLLTGAYNQVLCSRLRNAPGDRAGLMVHASAPLRSGDNVLGILNVAAPNWEAFSEEALVLLANVGSQIGIALERSRLYELLQEKRIYEQAVLLDVSNQLLTRSKLADLMSYLAEEVPSLLGWDACSILLVDDESKYLCFWAASGWYTDPVAAGRRVPADNRTMSGRSMLSREPIVVEDVEADNVAIWTAPWLYAEKFRGMAVVPLVAENRSIGSLVINHRQPRLLSEAELSLLRLMANQAAIAIEKARLHEEEIKRRRLEDELDVGHQIQLGLLPENIPVIEGWEFAAYYQPARQVGGDFYDFFELAGDPMQLGLVIADVAGKGVPAALFMALSRSLIRTKSMSGRLPAGVLSRANRLIYNDSRSKLFLTAFYATLDLRTGWLAYANAGHNRPLWVHGDTGEIDELRAQGRVLGIFEHIELEQKEIFMDPGDLIVLYTDGITEAMNEKEQLFGLERLYTLVRANYRANPQELIDAIIATIADFTGGTPQADDLTMFVVKRKREENPQTSLVEVKQI